MKKLVYLFCFFTPLLGLSQISELTNNGNQWLFKYESQAGISCENTLLINGDSTVFGKKYAKIFSKKDNICVCGIREDLTGKVFIRVFNTIPICTFTVPFEGLDTTKEILLYNFNASIGDTVIIRKYERLVNDTINIKIIVGSIQTDLFYGKERKIIGVYRTYLNGGDTDNIGEGVGSQIMLFNPLSKPASFTEGKIRTACFNGYGNSSGRCVINTNEIDNNSISLSNDLIGNRVTISIDDNIFDAIKKVQIIDFSGRVINEPSIGKSTMYDINTSNLSSGIYFLSIYFDSRVVTKKFIVIR